jgi:hypothetical protein
MGTFVGIIAAVLLLACLLFAGGGCSSRTSPPPPPPVVTSQGITLLDRTAVRTMLKRLADERPATQPPKELPLGAMCYEMAVPPHRSDYVCPKCGERTLYDSSKAETEKPCAMGLVATVQAIPNYRREIEELRRIAGDAITLDESQFCRKCSPKVKAPELVLHVSVAGEKPHDIDGITPSDLQILREFLSGKLLTSGDRGEKTRLKDQLPRLQELLGVKLDE